DPYGNRSSIFTTLIITGDYPVGTHRFVFTLEDICGNQTVRNYEFTVEDCTAPRADCIFGLEAELRATGSTILFARQFNAASADVCSNPVTFSFTENPADSIREFTCRDINRNIPIEIHVFDRVGNRSLCTTTLIVRPNDEIGCMEGAATIAGAIRMENEAEMDNVNISLSGVSESSLTTSVNGEFSFMNVTSGGDYTITPIKEDDYVNGVTTFDLVLIRTHILALSRTTSPYKLIAADINRSGNISTFDMVELRKLILGINSVFPSNNSWRFIDAGFPFENPTNPWASEFPEVANINNLPEGYLEVNFVAVKIGDVNLSATPNFQATDDRHTSIPDQFLEIENQFFNKNENIEVVLKSADLNDWMGCQMALEFDSNTLQFIDYQSNALSEAHLNLKETARGKIALSWTGEAKSNELIRLQFKTLQSGELAQHFQLTPTPLAAEAYAKTDNSIYNLGLKFITSDLPQALYLLKNTPNPFQKETTIQFYLPSATPVTLMVRDIAGRIVLQEKTTLTEGYQDWKISGKDLPANGIYYYQISTEKEQVIGKMLKI
ncbi:MAG: T9SS type A sorting domain-containing protein, partial [Saprospiraceae bacterium]